MCNLIIFLLVVLLCIYVTLFFVLKGQIKSIIKQLKDINDDYTNFKLVMFSSKKELVELGCEINKILEEKQKEEIKYKKSNLQTRQAISNISHDLRTPLTSIMGYLQLMEDDTLSKQEKKEYMGIVKNRTEALKVLITSFYDLSRLEGNEYKFNNKLLNLSDIITESIVSFYNDFTNRGMEPIVDIDYKIPLINIDEKATKRIFSNLIFNILKYGENFVKVSLMKRGKYIITTFTNDVKNLNEEDVKYLFNRFFTAERARTGESTGIGLAITKELVNQMGNEISAKLLDNRLSIIIKWKIPR